MKKKAALLMALAAIAIIKLKNKKRNIPLIGEKAPSFRADTTQGKINFPEDYKGKWVILFSHPADFTPVCTTEFMAFQTMIDEFSELNTSLVGLSVDSLSSHFAWLKTIRDNIDYNGMENLDITFALIDDKNLKVAKKYGMIHPGASDTKTVRAVFIIDPKGIIRAILYYPQSNGRNLREIKRLLIALQTTDEFGVVTPANWKPGEDVILPPPNSCADIKRLLEQEDKDENVKCYEWFLCFKGLPKEEIIERIYIRANQDDDCIEI